MPCINYKEFTLNRCPDAFIINGNFTPNITYLWRFTYPVDYILWGSSITAEDGSLTVEVDGMFLKKEYFQPWKQWEFRIYSVDEAGNEIPVLFCDFYDVLLFKFVNPGTLPDPNNVVVDLECVIPT